MKRNPGFDSPAGPVKPSPPSLRRLITAHLKAAGWEPIDYEDHWAKGKYRLRFEDAVRRQLIEEDDLLASGRVQVTP